VGQHADLFVLSKEGAQTVAKKREVKVAFFARDQVALSGGVNAGDRVITDGALYLSDGEQVSVQTEAQP
jgi:multidrug efflux pump subunit AcrA (membrane-fusion protein)